MRVVERAQYDAKKGVLKNIHVRFLFELNCYFLATREWCVVYGKNRSNHNALEDQVV